MRGLRRGGRVLALLSFSFCVVSLGYLLLYLSFCCPGLLFASCVTMLLASLIYAGFFSFLSFPFRFFPFGLAAAAVLLTAFVA